MEGAGADAKDGGFSLVLEKSPVSSSRHAVDLDEQQLREVVVKAAQKGEELLRDPGPEPPTRPPNIAVVCRVRPVLAHEKERIGTRIVGSTRASHAQVEYVSVVPVEHAVHSIIDEKKLGRPTGRFTARSFPVHKAYAPTTGNEALFDDCVTPLIACALAGGTGTLIAYGQTGSGKTYTVQGFQGLAAQRLFTTGRQTSMQLSFFELMGRRCFDLLSDRALLEIREDERHEVHVAGLTTVTGTSQRDVERILARGNSIRATAPTASNDQSSRSHAICTMELSSGGKLVLVDLAGSERREDALGHSLERAMEMRDNNASLGTLKECIRLKLARTADHRVHVPYRRSKLTLLLRGAFEASVAGEGPEPAVCFMVHVSPLRSQAKHTVNTLEYASHMLLATFLEREQHKFLGPERWTSKQVVEWVRELDGGRFADVAWAFSRCTGKMLAVEFCPDVVQVREWSRWALLSAPGHGLTIAPPSPPLLVWRSRW